MGRTEREVQLAGLLQFAPEQEDRLGSRGGRWDRELDVLSGRVSGMILAAPDFRGLSKGRSVYFIMRQSHPRRQIVRDRQDVPQCINLKFIKRLVDGRFEQCLKLMHTILELGRRFWVLNITIAISVWY